TKPVITIEDPAAGSTFMAGTIVPLSITVSDNFGVTGIDYLVTGAFELSGSVSVDLITSPKLHVIELPIPNELVNDGSAFTVSVTASDAAGNTSIAAARSFSLPDLVPPVVLSSVPADGAERVRLRPTIQVTLSKALDPETILPGVLVLAPETEPENPVAATVRLNANGRTIELLPDADLLPETRYCMNLSNSVADTTGNFLVEAYTACFTTLTPARAGPVAGRAVQASSLTFDGIDDYVQIRKVALPTTGAGATAELWFKTTQSKAQLLLQNLGGHGMGFYLGRFTPGQALFFFDGSTANDTEDFGPNLSDGEWHHAAGVWENGTVSIYVDGELVGTKPEGLIATVSGGSIGSNQGINAFFGGEMTEVRMWNVARTEEELLRDMHRRLDGTEPGLVSYYPMQEGMGRAAYDYSDFANTGVLGGGTANYQPAWSADMPVFYEAVQDITLEKDGSVVASFNGHDPSGATLTRVILELPAHGRLFQTADGINPDAEILVTPATVVDLDGRVVYEPEAGFIGRDSLIYRIQNAWDASAPAVARLHIAPLNALPVAGDLSVDATSGIVNSIDGILDYATDPDGDSIKLVHVSDPIHGTVQWNSDGTVAYTPEDGYSGSDSFTYRVADSVYWQRHRDYGAGTQNQSQTGNPRPDNFGFEVWQFESVLPSGDLPGEAWYALHGPRMTWNLDWSGLPNIWSRGLNAAPTVSESQLEQALEVAVVDTHVPLVRWIAPYDGLQVDVVGEVELVWTGDAASGELVEAEWGLAHYTAESGVVVLLDGGSVMRPADNDRVTIS
ncbi:MAG TPA: Ig-like domain-containing protein, partial [Oceanipulchritudo sp.]|nr:Ig-like domain-containing protein [Oceanipulchritudo sp.]